MQTRPLVPLTAVLAKPFQNICKHETTSLIRNNSTLTDITRKKKYARTHARTYTPQQTHSHAITRSRTRSDTRTRTHTNISYQTHQRCPPFDKSHAITHSHKHAHARDQTHARAHTNINYQTHQDARRWQPFDKSQRPRQSIHWRAPILTPTKKHKQ